MTSIESREARVEGIWPLLLVDDLQRSLRFWRDVLDFEVVGEAADADDEVYWCRVERDGASVMLQARHEDDGPQAHATTAVTLYFVCDDARTFHSELVRRGLGIEPPVRAPYGMLQLFVPEPDGYPVCFESRDP